MVRRGRARGTGFRTGPHPTRPDRTRPSCRARFRGGPRGAISAPHPVHSGSPSAARERPGQPR